MDHVRHSSFINPILLDFLKAKHPNGEQEHRIIEGMRERMKDDFNWGSSYTLIMLLYECFDHMDTEVTYHIQSGCVMVRYRDEEGDSRYPCKNIIYDWPSKPGINRRMKESLYLAALDYILWYNQREKNRQSKKSEPR